MSDRSASGPAHAAPAARRIAPNAIEDWLRDLRELGLEAGDRVERDGIAAWDVTLDGRRRRDLRTTVIFDPNLGLIAWAHLAPPLGDGLRKAYRTLLRWNDEFPLAKLSVADDGRPILSVEVPIRWLDADELGLALARVAGIADRVFDETRGWLWIGGRVPDGYAERPVRTARLLDRYAQRLGELVTADEAPEPGPEPGPEPDPQPRPESISA